MFYSEHFSFDNISSKDMGVILVTQNDDILMEYGIGYESNLNSEKAINSIEDIFFSEEKTSQSIEMSLCLVDDKLIPIPWTLQKRNEILNWIVQKEFKPFVSEDTPNIVHYFKCIGVKKELSADMTGLLTLTMQPISPYAYTPISIQKYKTSNSKVEFIIDNPSNLHEVYYPQIEIVSLSDNESIEIYNTTVSDTPFVINNLNLNEVVEIDGLLKTVFNDKDEQRLTDCNRAWLKLIRGQNIIKVRGNCLITVKSQFPMLV